MFSVKFFFSRSSTTVVFLIICSPFFVFVFCFEKFEYIKHLNTFHSFNFKFECKYCKKRFRYFSHYQQHKNIHEKVKTSNLSFQNKSFDESRQVEQEILNEINKNSTFQINQCYVCGKKFSKLFNFKRHIKNSHK